MSRIDQALERARLTHADEIPAGIAPEGAPPETFFNQAWDLDRAEKGHEPRNGADSPVRRPHLLGAAPSAAAKALALSDELAEKTVVSEGMSRLAIEQYRRLTAKLHHAQIERPIKRLMIISAVAGEGKTLTSLNLALTLSRSHKSNVLLVDADLRRPSLHEAFGVPGDPGLREAVARPLGEPAPVRRIDERLALLTGGKPTTDPIQVLSSPRMRELVTRAGDEYDWVVIDTPPLAVLPDANVLGDLVDAAVLVISAGSTPHDLALKAVKLLGRERIVGVVLNGAEARDLGAARYLDSYAHYMGS